MGKCGARELNYISDVDVIFVAEPSGELESSRALEIATKLLTRMMRIMDEVGTEPALWQVDANLRPEGKSGALVRSLDSHQSYYERWAESWEFQALLKARPIAGDQDLGQQYIEIGRARCAKTLLTRSKKCGSESPTTFHPVRLTPKSSWALGD